MRADVGREVDGARGRLLDRDLQRHQLVLKDVDVLGQRLELVSKIIDHAVIPENHLVAQRRAHGASSAPGSDLLDLALGLAEDGIASAEECLCFCQLAIQLQELGLQLKLQPGGLALCAHEHALKLLEVDGEVLLGILAARNDLAQVALQLFVARGDVREGGLLRNRDLAQDLQECRLLDCHRFKSAHTALEV